MSTQNTHWNVKLLGISLLLSSACFLLFSFMVQLINDKHLANQRVEVNSKLSTVRLQLEQQLNSTFYLTRGLAQFLQTETMGLQHSQQQLQAWADNVLQTLPHVRNIGLSEGTTLRYAFPLEGNESIIGVDFRDLPHQWPAVKKTIATKQPLVAGPLNLIQGGTGIICRIPLFASNGQLLGLVSMVIDYPALLKSAGIIDANQHLAIAIRRQNDDSTANTTFYGDPELFEQNNIVMPIEFVGGSWQLAAKPLRGWSKASPQAATLLALGTLLSLFIGLISYLGVDSLLHRLHQNREFTHQLEQEVHHRTQQLQHAKEQAEQANQSKSVFLATMTHELRTPLNSVIGLTELIETMELGEKQRFYLKRVEVSAKLLLNLINDILSFAKIESGNSELRPSDFDPQALLAEMTSLFDSAAAQKGLQFNTDCQTPMPAQLHADRGKIQQVLLNLCGNAIKFTEQGEVTLSAHFDALNQRLHLAVEDTGSGISEADLQRLFIPFHQLDDSLSRQYQGTGLGLTICKGLCEVMGGSISVNSVLGRGSRFEVTLPVTAHDNQTATAPRFDKAKLISETRQQLAGSTLILAEDNPVNQTVALALLDKIGITTLIANDGQEVLDLLALHDQIDGILMDLQMPRLDGLATCRQIKAHPGWQHIPVIAMTANAMDEDRQRAHNAGMIGFVAKPISIRTLYETLQECLS